MTAGRNWRDTVKRDPHLVLGVAASLELACEALRGHATLLSSPVWPALQAVIAAAGLFVAWRRQDRLRLAPVLTIAVTWQVAWIVLHLLLGVASDGDSSMVYPREGDALLGGSYPAAEYPPGAVLLFAFDSLLSGGGHGVRVSHAFMMVPFQLVAVLAVWSLRTAGSRWLAAVLALSPLNAFFWEFKFDLAPTALLAVGLALAFRRRWGWAGVALGAGAAVKWSPALSGVALALWLLARGQRRAAVAHAVGLAGTFALVNLPFLATSPSAVLAAYRLQSGRGISAESMFYLPPLIGPEHSIAMISHDVGAPGWANVAAGALQVALVLALLVATTRVRTLAGAIGLAAMAPVLFLLSNRVFSPQYLVTALAAWIVAAALVLETRRQQLLVGLLAGVATLANVLVYPTGSRLWPSFSVILFVTSFGVSAWLVVRSLQLSATPCR